VWLRWIEDHKHAEASARELADWLREERGILNAFVKKAVERSTEDGGGDERSTRGPRLLDIGSGTGKDIAKLLRQNPSLHAVGIDIIPRNVSEAWERIHQANLTDRAAIFLSDAAALTDLGDPFDIAICMTNTVGNLTPQKQEELVRGLRTTLKPNGQVLMFVYSEASVPVRLESYNAIGLQVVERDNFIAASEGLRSQHFTAESLRSLLEENGLEIIGDVQRVASIGLAVVATPLPE